MANAKQPLGDQLLLTRTGYKCLLFFACEVELTAFAVT